MSLSVSSAVQVRPCRNRKRERRLYLSSVSAPQQIPSSSCSCLRRAGDPRRRHRAHVPRAVMLAQLQDFEVARSIRFTDSPNLLVHTSMGHINDLEMVECHAAACSVISQHILPFPHVKLVTYKLAVEITGPKLQMGRDSK